MLAPVHRSWGNRVVRECVSLVEAGYRVTALVRCEHAHSIDGVQFIPAPSYRNRLQRFLRIPQVLFAALREKADVYHLHNPDMIPVALALKLLGKKVIYDTHEDYSQRLLIRSWLPRPLRRTLSFLISRAERGLSRWVDATLVTQEQQLVDFPRRCHLLRNAPSISEEMRQRSTTLAAHIDRRAGEYRLIYAGGISKTRGLYNMLAALDILNSRGLPVRLWLLGPDLENCLSAAVKHPGWSYVDYLRLQSHEAVFAHMARADIGLAMLEDVGDHAAALPSKLFEYMAWGLPFVASDFPLWREFTGEHAGLWVRPGSPELLAEQLSAILPDAPRRQSMGEGAAEFIGQFTWLQEQEVLLKLYAQIVEGRCKS
ncbi:glycosyltransferase [Aquipseudomonas campi]|uniref:Glycosyltransferase n=1 Tax=Aquipseudomonas campi TaxID=2731681 RepID=A0A6M8G077_9GAMM|nr:glycosyltransferase [Pseudomonas campi]QKE65456.1 glycosyltransferase [Pseudomonas campi]